MGTLLAGETIKLPFNVIGVKIVPATISGVVVRSEPTVLMALSNAGVELVMSCVTGTSLMILNDIVPTLVFP